MHILNVYFEWLKYLTPQHYVEYYTDKTRFIIFKQDFTDVLIDF